MKEKTEADSASSQQVFRDVLQTNVLRKYNRYLGMSSTLENVLEKCFKIIKQWQ